MTEESFTFFFDEVPVKYVDGQSIAAALIGDGRRRTRTSRVGGSPRGLFCGIGACFDCLVVIDGIPNQRSCMTVATEQMRVETQNGSES